MTKYKLSDQTLALMANHLQVPMIISDMVNGPQKPLRDEITYGLHDLLSEMDPLSALLTIAIGTRSLINTAAAETPTVKTARMETGRIIATYQSLWLANAQSPFKDPEDVLCEMQHIAQDLEGLAELLSLLRQDMDPRRMTGLAFADILSTQARAIALTAQHLAEEYDLANDDGADAGDIPVPDMMILKATERQGQNVIPFPRRS